MNFQLIEFNNSAIVTADIEVNANNLMLSYSVDAVDDVVWPEFMGHERQDELWRSTCFELFLSSPGDSYYLEFNLSPSGAWNSYSFSDYRDGMAIEPGIELTDFTNESSGVISATFAIQGLPNPAWLGPAAILANADGCLRYLATTHGEAPDFHDRHHHVLVALDHL